MVNIGMGTMEQKSDARPKGLNSPARQRFTIGQPDAICFEYVVEFDVVWVYVFGPCPLTLSLVIFLLGHVVPTLYIRRKSTKT